MENGEPVEFEFNSADATAGAVISIRSEGGGARTLAVNERFILRSFTGSIAAAVLNAVMFKGADATVDAGELMAAFGLGSSNGSDLNQSGTLGAVPRIKAAVAGQIYVVGHGVITLG